MINEMDNDGNTTSTGPEQPVAGKSLRKGLTIGLAVGLLGGTAAGFAFGVPGLSSAATPGVVQQTEETVPDAEATDPAPADVESGTRLRDALQPLVDAGTITAEQADAVVTQLKESMPERGDGRGGPFGRGGHRGFPFDGEVLETLGIDIATLRDQLSAGSSLADIAAAQGVDVQMLIDALVAEGSERIDEAVTAGRIDEAEAATRKAELETRVTEMVNKVFDGSFGDRRGRGPGEPPVDEVPAEAETPVTTED